MHHTQLVEWLELKLVYAFGLGEKLTLTFCIGKSAVSRGLQFLASLIFHQNLMNHYRGRIHLSRKRKSITANSSVV